MTDLMQSACRRSGATATGAATASGIDVRLPSRLRMLRAVLRRSPHPTAFCTDAEMFQAILHRYRAQGRWQDGQQLFTRFAALMQSRIESVAFADVEHAAALAAIYPPLDARDLLHLAVMDRVGATQIVSADRGFDAASHVKRLDPTQLASWRHLFEPAGSV